MWSLSRTAVCALLVLVLALARTTTASVENLNFERVRLVDFIPDTGSFLFRGNMPQLNASTFAYDELFAYLQTRVAEAGLSAQFPATTADMELIDITFLTPEVSHDEAVALALEQSWFGANPSVGTLQWTPLYGDARDPWNYGEPERNDISRALSRWQVDALVKHIGDVRTRLLTPRPSGSRVLVLYFHCGHGQDRTGEFATLYYLQYLGWSWSQVWAFNNATIGMDVPNNVHSAMWACQYAQNALHTPQAIDCTDVL